MSSAGKVRNGFSVMVAETRETFPVNVGYPKASESRADKFSAQSQPETTPMSSTASTAQESCSATLTALHRTLKELAAKTKPGKPVIAAQGPVMVIRGK